MHMTEGVFDKVLREVKHEAEIARSGNVENAISRNTLKTVSIVGVGEPTTHPEFSKYSGLLAHENMELTSNAYYWSEETIDTMVSMYKKVTVSVDGLPKSFAAARGFDFEVMAENVKRLVRAKLKKGSKFPFIHAQLVLSKDNLHDVKELIPMLKKIGFAKLLISNLLPQTEADKDKIVYTPYIDKEMRDFVKTWYPIGSATGLQIKIPQTKFNANHRCGFIEAGALFITADGYIAPCLRFAHDGQEFVFGRKKKIKPVYFGDIKNNTLSEIWNTKEYLTFRYMNFAGRFPSCVDCDHLEFCDYIKTSEADCYASEPSCADCLWCRGLIECP